MPFTAAAGSLGYQKNSARLPLALSTDFTGSTNAFVAKYTTTGTVLWTARIAAPGRRVANQIFGTATDSTGAVYAVGQASMLGDRPGATAVVAGGGGAALFAYNADGTLGGVVRVINPDNYTDSVPFLVKYSAAGAFQWCGYLVGGRGVRFGYGIAIDPSDGIYMTGSVGGSTNQVQAYNGDGTRFGTVYTTYDSDAFLVKYNTAGSVQWLTRVSVSDFTNVIDNGYGVVADSTGVYMTGQVGIGTVTAWNAAGTSGRTFTTTSADVFLVKYTLAGVVSWLARMSSTAADVGYRLALDTSGNVYVCGQYGAATMTAFSGSGAAFGTTLASIGSGDSFLVKYNSSGVVQWVARQGGTAADTGFAVATDSAGNVYLSGGMGAATFTAHSSNGTAFGTTLTSRGLGDAFLVEYSPTGTVQWVAQVAGTAADVGVGLVVDSADNVYMAVSTSSTSLVVYNSDASTFTTLSLTTTPASAIVQYNGSGTAQRATALNSSTTPSAISRDATPTLILGGTTSAYIARNLGPSTTVLHSLAFTIQGSFLAKYSGNGTPLWASRVTGGTIRDVTTGPGGTIYATGSAGSSTALTIFNVNGTTFGTIPIAHGFLAKYTSAGNAVWAAWWSGGGFASGVGERVGVDSSGFVYVAGAIAPVGGSVSNSHIIYDGSGNVAITRRRDANQSADGMLVKYSSDGSAQWFANVIQPSSSTGKASLTDLAIGPDNSIGVTGGGGGTQYSIRNADQTAFSTSFNAPLGAVYNSSGRVQRTAGVSQANGNASFTAVAIDSSGAVYFGGAGGSATAGAIISPGIGGASSTNLGTIANSQADGFLVKYDVCGRGQWVSKFSSTDGADRVARIAIDRTREALYLIGTSSGGSAVNGPIEFRASDGGAYAPPVSKANSGGFLVKYSSLTDLYARPQWGARFDSSMFSATNDDLFGVATDRRGNVYTVGRVNDVSAGRGILSDAIVTSYLPTTNITLSCHDSNGMLRWYQSVRGSGNFALGRCVATDFDGNVIVAGQPSVTTQTLNFYAKA